MKLRNLGQVRITDEALARLLGIPEDCKPMLMSVDSRRRTLTLMFESKKPIPGLTLPVAEAQEPPSYALPSEIPDEGPIPLAYLKIYHEVRQRLTKEEPVDPVIYDIDEDNKEDTLC